MVIPRDGFFYPFPTRIMDSFVLLTTIYLFIFKLIFQKSLNVKMQFHTIMLLGILGKIAWVR